MADLQDKIHPYYQDMFKTMLGISEIPDILAERYFLIKKMTDKVNGRLNPADLAEMAIDVGFNPNTKTFEPQVNAEGASMLKNVFSEPTKITPAVEQKPQTTVAESPLPEIEEDEGRFTQGARVDVLLLDEIISGTVKRVILKDDDCNYEVELDNGNVVKVSEDEVEKAKNG